MINPYDPALDRPCPACAKGLHGACMGWWHWCPCDCGLTDDDPRTQISNHQGDP